MAVPARVAADAAAADVQLAQLALAAAQGELPPSNEPVQPTNPSLPAAPPVQDLPPAPAPLTPPTAQPVDQTALLLQMQQSLRTVEGRLANETLERQRAQQRLEELQRLPPAPPAPPTAVPVTDTERNDFGPDTVDFITKIAQHFASQAANQFGQRLAQIEGRLNNTVQQVQHVAQVEQQSVADRYLAALTSAVPDWQAVNVDDKFIAWLQNTDKASNKAYMDLLQAAHEQGNAGSVIYIFNLYKQANGLLVAESPPANTPPTPPSNGRIDPASLAAPSTTAPAPLPSGQPPQGKLWTMAEVDALYRAYERKEITKQVFEQKEQEYLQALREGRVQV